MNNPLLQTIDALAKEKGIESEVIISAIEDAVLTASRKYYKTNENLRTKFNQETGQVELFAVKTIVAELRAVQDGDHTGHGLPGGRHHLDGDLMTDQHPMVPEREPHGASP